MNSIVLRQKELKKNNSATKAAELADPFLKDKKAEELTLLSLQLKDIRKAIKDFDDKMRIEKIREIIEANTTLVFCQEATWTNNMEYKDDCIFLRISDEVEVTQNDITKTLGRLHHFKIADLFTALPSKYWGGIHRDKQIDSILED